MSLSLSVLQQRAKTDQAADSIKEGLREAFDEVKDLKRAMAEMQRNHSVARDF